MAGLTNQEVAACFDAAAHQYDACSNRYAVRRRVEALAPYVRGRSFEIGGGTGAVTAALADRSNALHSDVAPEMCRLARKKLACRSLCCDAEAIPLIDESIDTAISAEMIYYLQHPERFTAEAFRVLRPGGTLLLCTTSPTAAAWDHLRSILRRLGFRRMFFQDGSPRFLGLSRLKLLLDQAGFVVEKTRRIVLFPFAVCDRLNRLLEHTLLRHLAIFTVIVARKPAAVDARETVCIPNRSSGVVPLSEGTRGRMNETPVLLDRPFLETADERT